MPKFGGKPFKEGYDERRWLGGSLKTPSPRETEIKTRTKTRTVEKKKYFRHRAPMTDSQIAKEEKEKEEKKQRRKKKCHCLKTTSDAPESLVTPDMMEDPVLIEAPDPEALVTPASEDPVTPESGVREFSFSNLSPYVYLNESGIKVVTFHVFLGDDLFVIDPMNAAGPGETPLPDGFANNLDLLALQDLIHNGASQEDLDLAWRKIGCQFPEIVYSLEGILQLLNPGPPTEDTIPDVAPETHVDCTSHSPIGHGGDGALDVKDTEAVDAVLSPEQARPQLDSGGVTPGTASGICGGDGEAGPSSPFAIGAVSNSVSNTTEDKLMAPPLDVPSSATISTEEQSAPKAVSGYKFTPPFKPQCSPRRSVTLKTIL